MNNNSQAAPENVYGVSLEAQTVLIWKISGCHIGGLHTF